jgi:hypothetical protein
VKTQCRRNQIYQRGQLLQFHSWKVPVAAKISVLVVLADSQPVIRSLKGKVNVFAGFQFKDCQPAGPGYRQQIENAMFPSGAREDL